MNPKHLLPPALAAALLLLGGCATADPGPFAPTETNKFTLENTSTFVALDRAVQQSATCTGIQERALADGRLEVVANIKNKESRRIEVQVSCVFKDDLGASTGDETPFQTLILSENATEAVRFTAMNTLAKKYTIRVRQPR